ncbi:NAD(P)H-quinone oxidoreductase subunit T, chloroplastic [Benincasa hispida]|uniref:NAD(P)H-quinone oxidoreductase subunit T, chloroplastic n=1 Tax=Benincasa hispida TaxID=102211 RepID=UPI0019004D32|nr:NAD(P)H-quinone oxidoreductase subunit T, chloroplastic [Benincasa hispida]
MASPPIPNSLLFHKTFHSSARTFRSWRVYASQAPNNDPQRRPPPGVDTRIHWQNQEEGWIGGHKKETKVHDNKTLGPSLADLLNNSSDSHYQFLGVGAEAELEEIKSAYRRLSKEYHPDTTSLPLKVASEKFMKLKQVYEVLSNEESRKFYDWTLAQEEASRQAEKLRIKLEDPYEQELQNWKSTPDMVDRLGGRNMELSDQATTALTLDIFIILFAIACIVYVLLFKEPYYY